MNRKFGKFRIILVLVTLIFLWCHTAQAMPMGSDMSGMDCGQTKICSLCGYPIQTGSLDLVSSSYFSSFIPVWQPLSEDSTIERLYHPPR